MMEKGGKVKIKERDKIKGENSRKKRLEIGGER